MDVGCGVRRGGSVAPRWRFAGVCGLVVGMVLGLGACGGDSPAGEQPSVTSEAPMSTGASASDTASATPTGSAAKVQALVDIQQCDNAGGTGTASGTVLNTGEAAASYVLTMGFLDASGTTLAQASYPTGEVPAGEEVPWSLTATGLGDAEVTCRTVSLTAEAGAEVTASQSGGSAAAAAGQDYPCSLLERATVEKAMGNPLADGDGVTSPVDQDGVTWTAQQCTWSAEQPGGAEVILAVTKADGFPSGDVACPALPDPASSVDATTGTAQWSWTDAGTAVKVGVLRLCTEAALIDVTISGESDQATLKAAATSLAEQVSANLG